jgi:hypothetical protein
MAGAAITITVLTLAAVNTLGIPVDLPTALLLSVVASLCACGASGVAGGSLLLIPLACNMFGIECRHAGSRRRLYYRRIAGLLRNGAELFTDVCLPRQPARLKTSVWQTTPCAANPCAPPLSGGGLFLVRFFQF